MWPYPQAIAQRVYMYFEDLVAGKDISMYGTEKEIPYSPLKRNTNEKPLIYNTVQGSLLAVK